MILTPGGSYDIRERISIQEICELMNRTPYTRLHTRLRSWFLATCIALPYQCLACIGDYTDISNVDRIKWVTPKDMLFVGSAIIRSGQVIFSIDSVLAGESRKDIVVGERGCTTPAVELNKVYLVYAYNTDHTAFPGYLLHTLVSHDSKVQALVEGRLRSGWIEKRKDGWWQTEWWEFWKYEIIPLKPNGSP